MNDQARDRRGTGSNPCPPNGMTPSEAFHAEPHPLRQPVLADGYAAM